MTLPLKILNRLRLGQDVAAEVTPTISHHLAWVYIYPLIDYTKARIIDQPGHERRIMSADGSNPIEGFLIRYIEVEERIVADFHQGRLYDPDRPTIDQRIVVTDEAELVTVLGKWIHNFLSLHIPEDVGYWFNRGPDLGYP